MGFSVVHHPAIGGPPRLRRQDAKDKGTRVLATNDLDQFKIGLADFMSPVEQNPHCFCIGQLTHFSVYLSQYLWIYIYAYTFIVSPIQSASPFEIPTFCFPSWLCTQSYKRILFSTFGREKNFFPSLPSTSNIVDTLS